MHDDRGPEDEGGLMVKWQENAIHMYISKGKADPLAPGKSVMAQKLEEIFKN